jgi:hypothetical protein
MAETYHNFRFSESNIFWPGLETKISLNPLTKLAFWRRRFRAVEDRAREVIRCELIKLICPVGATATAYDIVIRRAIFAWRASAILPVRADRQGRVLINRA